MKQFHKIDCKLMNRGFRRWKIFFLNIKKMRSQFQLHGKGAVRTEKSHLNFNWDWISTPFFEDFWLNMTSTSIFVPIYFYL